MATRRTLYAVAALSLAIAVHADIVVGVNLSATGPLAPFGITQKNSLTLCPDTIGGEKLRLVVVDDASDPNTGTRLACRLVTKSRADTIASSSVVAPSIAITEVTIESYIP